MALAKAVEMGELDAEFVLVGCDQAGAKICEEAEARGIRTWVCPQGKYQTKLEPEIEEELGRRLVNAGAELVVLAGYMRVVKAPLLDRYRGAMVNIHPSLLPAFPGLRAWEQALQAGVKETGCTVHWVNEVVDGGSILIRFWEFTAGRAEYFPRLNSSQPMMTSLLETFKVRSLSLSLREPPTSSRWMVESPLTVRTPCGEHSARRCQVVQPQPRPSLQ